jgi:N-acetylglucosaminyl-diphospho-decaprenol L-rhamnosyltransferase
MPSGAGKLEVTVVIVSFRSAALTIRSLLSVAAERAQSQLLLRAVVVDNDSGDLPQIEQAVDDNGWRDWVTPLAAPRNGGFAYGTNVGMTKAYELGHPDYICLLNPDTQLRGNAIGELVSFMEEHPDVGIAGSSFETHEGHDWPFAFRFPTLWSEVETGLKSGLATRLLRRWVVPVQMPKTPTPIDWVCGASMLIRKEVLAKVGGLDENYFLYYEETDFCRRVRAAGYATWYVPASRVMHVGGQSTQLDPDPGRSTRRFPAHWFESRRRYFAATFGIPTAVVIDACAVAAYSLGKLKGSLGARSRGTGPRFIRDLIQHSVFWRRNRALPTVRSFVLRK